MNKPTDVPIDDSQSTINIPANSPNIFFQFSPQELAEAENALNQLACEAQLDSQLDAPQPSPEKKLPKPD